MRVINFIPERFSTLADYYNDIPDKSLGNNMRPSYVVGFIVGFLILLIVFIISVVGWKLFKRDFE